MRACVRACVRAACVCMRMSQSRCMRVRACMACACTHLRASARDCVYSVRTRVRAFLCTCTRVCDRVARALGLGLRSSALSDLLKRRLTCGIGLWSATVTTAAKVKAEGVAPRPMVLLLHTVQNNTLQRSTTCCNLAHQRRRGCPLVVLHTWRTCANTHTHARARMRTPAHTRHAHTMAHAMHGSACTPCTSFVREAHLLLLVRVVEAGLRKMTSMQRLPAAVGGGQTRSHTTWNPIRHGIIIPRRT